MIRRRKRGKRKAQRVSVRLKVRERRRRSAGLALRVLAAAAVLAGAAASPRLRSRVRSAVEGIAVVRSVDAGGVPAPLQTAVAESLGSLIGLPVGPLELRRREKELAKAYPYLKEVRLKRSFLRRTVSAEADLRRPLAALSKGRFLGGDGRVFEGPPELFPEDVPSARFPDKTPNLGPLASFLLETAGELRIERVAYEGPEEGWSLRLQDGPTVRWGELRRTAEKVKSLKQVLNDARGRFQAVGLADLRFFEDGRVLVRPAPIR